MNMSTLRWYEYVMIISVSKTALWDDRNDSTIQCLAFFVFRELGHVRERKLSTCARRENQKKESCMIVFVYCWLQFTYREDVLNLCIVEMFDATDTDSPVLMQVWLPQYLFIGYILLLVVLSTYEMKIRCFRRMKVNNFWSKCARSKITGLILSLFISVCLSVSLFPLPLSPPSLSLLPPSLCVWVFLLQSSTTSMQCCDVPTPRHYYISNFTNVKSCMSPVTFIIRKRFFLLNWKSS